MAQNTPVVGFLNITMISHVILRALAGSIGMVMIAPITAIVAGLFYHRS
ncbi:MAG: YibE/F family protein [Deltaproteobacteria bacterium]|nr:YibE/F family protein [Deltaproteobacteria bacterium]